VHLKNSKKCHHERNVFSLSRGNFLTQLSTKKEVRQFNVFSKYPRRLEQTTKCRYLVHLKQNLKNAATDAVFFSLSHNKFSMQLPTKKNPTI
jgi:hypothetical protein